MVTTTGTLVATGVPSALAGRVRSARSLTPSDIGIARSLTVVVPGYCSGRGFQVLAGAVEVPAAVAAPLVARAGVVERSGHQGAARGHGGQHSDERAW